jgi:hypothetical protein
MTLSIFPLEQAYFVQINGTGFAPGYLSVPDVAVSSTSDTGPGTIGPQSNADTVVNFDGTFQTAVQLLPPAFEEPSVSLYIDVRASLDIPYGINATVLDNGVIQLGSQGRNV